MKRKFKKLIRNHLWEVEIMALNVVLLLCLRRAG